MKLGNRLASAASLVRGKTAVDIGSDHGYLPVWLILNGVCEFAVAADINEKPLEKSRETALKYGVSDKMKFALSNGFDNINRRFDTACICGMGGIMISDILQRGSSKADYFVLQPMTNGEVLRKYLWENGFEITEEKYSFEDNKPYCVIGACYVGGKTEYTYTDTYLGKLREITDDYLKYVYKILQSAKKRLAGKLHNNAFADDEKLLVSECEKLLNTKQ